MQTNRRHFGASFISSVIYIFISYFVIFICILCCWWFVVLSNFLLMIPDGNLILWAIFFFQLCRPFCKTPVEITILENLLWHPPYAQRQKHNWSSEENKKQYLSRWARERILAVDFIFPVLSALNEIQTNCHSFQIKSRTLVSVFTSAVILLPFVNVICFCAL